MADFGSPVAQNVNPNAGLQTLQSILGIKQAQQNLQTGAIEQQRAQAAATVDTQTAQENQNLSAIMRDPVKAGIIDAKGNPTPDAENIVFKAAPTTGADVFGKLLTVARSRVDFNNSVNSLNQNERAEIGSTLAGAAASGDLRQVQSAAQQLLDAKAGTPTYDDYRKILDFSMNVVGHQSQNGGPQAGLQAALGMGRQVIGANAVVGAGGIAAPQTGTMDTGGQIQPGTVAPALQGGGFTPSGAPINKSLAPNVITMPDSTLRTVGGAYGAPPGGNGVAPQKQPPGQPRTASQDAPPANSPRAVIDAYNNATQQANSHVEQVRQADESYGNNVAISQAIRHLAGDANTGPGTQTWNKVMGFLGTDKANNYQELGAFLDRQAATVRGQMGLPGTNAGAEDAKMIAGNTAYNAKVIQDKNNYTQALTEGLHQYRNGLDRVAGFGGQASPQAVNQFKSAWTQNFDPNVFLGELAYKRSKAEGDSFVRSLEPEEAASLAAKRKALQALSRGQLPQ